MMQEQPRFTVFTPTYNRAHTLHRVFESLDKQTVKNFEWLVVDDGSSDDTRGCIQQWRRRGAFPIRYYYQENCGKHRAFNRAVRKAGGAFFVCLDSDDACLPEALEKFDTFWNSIPRHLRDGFAGGIVHCLDVSGRIIGDRFPRYCTDAFPPEMDRRCRIRGEKWGFYRTEVLRRFPYPEIQGERFIPEGIVWNRIGAAYRMRYVDEALRVYHDTARGLNARSRSIRIQSPKGARLYYRETLLHRPRPPLFFRNLLNYIAFSLHAGIAPGRICSGSGAVFTTLLCLPMGYAVYRYDRIFQRNLEKTP